MIFNRTRRKTNILVVFVLCLLLTVCPSVQVFGESKVNEASIASALPVDHFLFRNEITWETTPEQMIAAERKTDMETFQSGDLDFYSFSLKDEGDGETIVGYIFLGTQMIVTSYQFTSLHAYQRYLDALNLAYGAPTHTDAVCLSPTIWLIRSNNPIVANSVDDYDTSEIEGFAGWNLDDGTLITTFYISEDNPVIFFICEDRVTEVYEAKH